MQAAHVQHNQFSVRNVHSSLLYMHHCPAFVYHSRDDVSILLERCELELFLFMFLVLRFRIFCEARNTQKVRLEC